MKTKPADEARSEGLPSIRHEFVQANGVRLHVAITGEADRGDAAKKPLALLLHGFPECWYSWRHQLRAFAAAGFVAAAPDLRGYGDSEKPAPTSGAEESGYGLTTLAADAASLIRALGYERARLVAGHDWGGAIVYRLGERYPEVVERVAVLNCPPVDVLVRGALADPRQAAKLWYTRFFLLPYFPEKRLAADRCAIVPRIFKAGAVRREALSTEDLEVFREAMAKPGAVEAALAYYRTAGRALLGEVSPLRVLRRLLPIGRTSAPRRRLIQAPGLILWGRDDPWLGTRLTHGLERIFATSLEVRFIPRCGHWDQQEAPEEVSAALVAFAS